MLFASYLADSILMIPNPQGDEGATPVLLGQDAVLRWLISLRSSGQTRTES